MEFNRIHISFIAFLLLLSFFLGSQYVFLKNISGIILLFIIPGFLISLIFYQNIGEIERLVQSVVISIPLNICVAIFLNVALKIKIDSAFPLIVFILTTLPSLVKIILDKKIYKIQIKKLDKLAYFFIFTIIISIIARIILFSKITTLLGADIGRFSIISHTYVLKQNITPDLRPYDAPKGFFYFPGAIILPMMLELAGFDPIQGITLATLVLDIFSLFAFYILASRFFERKTAINAFFFYSLLFDALLNMAVFGVFPHAFSTFFLFTAMAYATDLFFQKKEFATLLFSIVGILCFHMYSLFIFISFVFALFSYEFVVECSTKKMKKFIFELVKVGLMSLAIISPFLLFFGGYYSLKFEKDNIADLITFSSERVGLSFILKVIATLFASPVGSPSTIVSILGFVVFLISLKKLIKSKGAILIFFFIYSALFVFFVFDDYNLSRNVFGNWIVYTMAFALVLESLHVNLAIIPIFFFLESQSPLFLVAYMKPIENPVVPWIIWPEYYDMISFIKESVPPNATFFIDGGGAGCTGANPSYGERIFPLTSRKIFYFTDYCWADYDKAEYQKKVELYRKVSINPNDDNAIEEMKSYGITHVYVGPYSVGLKPELFQAAKYEKVFEKNGNFIFRIK